MVWEFFNNLEESICSLIFLSVMDSITFVYYFPIFSVTFVIFEY